MLEKAKLALRVSANEFDSEVLDLINAALADLKGVGIKVPTPEDPLIIRAVMTYVKMNFGRIPPGNYAELKSSYDEQKAQLLNTSGYTDWGDGNGQR